MCKVRGHGWRWMWPPKYKGFSTFPRWSSPTPRHNMHSFSRNSNRSDSSNYLESCLSRHGHFAPFFFSTYVIIVLDISTILCCLSAKMSCNWKHPQSLMCGLFNYLILVKMIWSNHCFICGLLVPWTKANYWFLLREDRAVLGLFD